VKDGLSEINSDRVYLHGTSSVHLLYPQTD